MKSYILTTIFISSLSLLSRAQINLPYYQDFDSTFASGWAVGQGDVWFLDEEPDGNWVYRSEQLVNSNAYNYLFTPSFNTSSITTPRFRCKAKLAPDPNFFCSPEFVVVIENLDNSHQDIYEYGSVDANCSSHDISINAGYWFNSSLALPLNTNVRIWFIARFFDPGWIILDEVEILDFNSIGVSEVELLSSFKVYPSVTQDICTISLHVPEPLKIDIEVHNELGQTVLKSEVEGTEIQKQIDLSSQPSGMYFIRIITEEHVSITKKILKQ